MTTSAAPAITSPASRQPSPAPDRMRIVSIDAFRGFVMFLMLAEAMHLWTLHDGVPRQHVLGDRRLQHDARAVAGLLAPRPDPAGLLVPRRRVAAVLDREPRGRGESFGKMLGHAVRRSLILILLGIFLRSMEQPADLLDVRGHAHADRPRLHVPLPAGVRVAARAGRRLRRDPRRLLGGVRALPAAGPATSTTRPSACRRTGRTSTRASSRTSTRTRTCRGRSTRGS